MITIGLVGRIGAGKSTVARRFGSLGAHVVDADAIAHEVLEEPAVKESLGGRFGADVLGADGRIDRSRLAALVFGPTPAHAEALADLEALVHPRVHGRIEEALAAERNAARAAGRADAVVVLDVPLLVKAGWAEACDRIVIVECEDPVRRERLARRGVSAGQQAAREAAWDHGRAGAVLPPAIPPQNVFRVDTSGDLTYTWAQVDQVWEALLHR